MFLPLNGIAPSHGDILTALLCACSPRTDNFKAKIAQKFIMLAGFHRQTCVRQEQDVQHLNLWIFSFVWLGLTRFSQAAAGRNPWLDSSKYLEKHPKYYVRQQANAFSNFAECDSCRVNHHKCTCLSYKTESWTYFCYKVTTVQVNLHFSLSEKQ